MIDPDKKIADHVDQVREQLELSDKTRIRTNVKTTVSVVIAIIAGTVTICTFLNRIVNSQDRIEQALEYKWSRGDMSSWASSLDRANRGVTQADGSRGLNIPDPLSLPK